MTEVGSITGNNLRHTLPNEILINFGKFALVLYMNLMEGLTDIIHKDVKAT